MTDLVRDYLPWLLSGITIWMTLLAGNKHRNAWLVGLVAQALWLVWIVVTGTWGLLPMNAALWIVYTRNHLRWRTAHTAYELPLSELTGEIVALAAVGRELNALDLPNSTTGGQDFGRFNCQGRYILPRDN